MNWLLAASLALPFLMQTASAPPQRQDPGAAPPDAQAAAYDIPPPIITLPKGVHFYGVLMNRLDSKEMKPGDSFTAMLGGKITIDANTLPAGTRLKGHVTLAEAKSQGESKARLGLAFDQIEVPGQNPIECHGVVQAVGPGEVTAAGMGELRYRQKSTSARDMDSTEPVPDAPKMKIQLKDKGVFGGIRLSLEVDPKYGTVMVANKSRSIRLEPGTQFVVVTQ